jgi:hypothetical protein
MNLSLSDVLSALYDSELNYSLTAEWDDGIWVGLGDVMNGWDAETFVRTPDEAAAWLDENARRLYPKSGYGIRKKPPARSESNPSESATGTDV